MAIRTGFEGDNSLLSYIRSRPKVYWEAILLDRRDIPDFLYVYYDWEAGKSDDVAACWRDSSHQEWLPGYSVNWHRSLNKRDFWTFERARGSYELFDSGEHLMDSLPIDDGNQVMDIFNGPPRDSSPNASTSRHPPASAPRPSAERKWFRLEIVKLSSLPYPCNSRCPTWTLITSLCD